MAWGHQSKHRRRANRPPYPRPKIGVKDRLYVAHDRRITCAGSKALMDFARACIGFVSLSHFSRCYMRAFGRQPRHDRLRLICD